MMKECATNVKAALLGLIRRFLFTCARPLSVEKEQGLCLVISPHPDDETLGCGATILRVREAGRAVRLIIATDGSVSSHSSAITPQELVALRRSETLEAGRLLGLSPEDIIFLPFPDGSASEHISEMAEELRKHINQLNPQTIFSPYSVDGHADHRAVAAAVDRLFNVGAISANIYEYPIWFWPWGALSHVFKPLLLARLRRVETSGFIDHKRAALAAYISQSTNLTGEKNWWFMDAKFLTNFFQPYEIFFEKHPR